MSLKLTGDGSRVVDHLQDRLDKFEQASKSFERSREKVDACAAKSVELTQVPAHEAHFQTLLSEYKKAAAALKGAADRVQTKTDAHHVHKYCRGRHNYWMGTEKKPTHYIHNHFKEPLEAIHKVAKQILANDFDTPINQAQNASQRRILDAQAYIEFSLIDQTFPTFKDELITGNPPEYLRQAALYQTKLLEKKDEAVALAFGNSWIKNLPKEPTFRAPSPSRIHFLKWGAQNTQYVTTYSI